MAVEDEKKDDEPTKENLSKNRLLSKPTPNKSQ